MSNLKLYPRYFRIFIYICLLVFVLTGKVFWSLPRGGLVYAVDYFDLIQRDEIEDGYFTMKDLDSKETIMKTARIIHPGDKYINHENRFYRVERVEGNVAWALHLGQLKLSEFSFPEVSMMMIEGKGEYLKAQQEKRALLFGIYHSHGAESYVPTDGAESIAEGGGILLVGESLARALKERGMEVVHSTQTHVPHDAGAYQRSRRTAEELLRKGAGVLLDIHRDAVPAEEYTTNVNNRPTVQLQFVVGRQNQNAQINRAFAESLKSLVDNEYPGLVKGIFLAKGNYNQDMLPMSLLIEVGSHENTREGAERSVAYFADVLNLYFVGQPGIQAREGLGVRAVRGILWLVFATGIVLGLYLLLSTGSTEELRAKLNNFIKKEFRELSLQKNKGDAGGEGGGK